MTAARVAPLALAVAVALLWPAAPAVAIDPGVVYEPGSPAGKEYAIPLEEARRDAGSRGREGSDPRYEAFGSGVTPPGGDGHAGGPRSAGGSRPGRGGSRRGAVGGGVSRTGLANAEAAGGAGSRTLLILLAVAIPGLVLGLLLGRMQRRPAA